MNAVSQAVPQYFAVYCMLQADQPEIVHFDAVAGAQLHSHLRIAEASLTVLSLGIVYDFVHMSILFS